MVEGGFELLNTLNSTIDMLVLFISYKDKSLKNIDIELYFNKKVVYFYKINQNDKIFFLI